MNIFSAVLVPNTYNTRSLRHIGVVLTNVVYDGVLITNRHEGQDELNHSQILFLRNYQSD